MGVIEVLFLVCHGLECPALLVSDSLLGTSMASSSSLSWLSPPCYLRCFSVSTLLLSLLLLLYSLSPPQKHFTLAYGNRYSPCHVSTSPEPPFTCDGWAWLPYLLEPLTYFLLVNQSVFASSLFLLFFPLSSFALLPLLFVATLGLGMGKRAVWCLNV
ncbi:hypothetical protein B0I35DRAFT_244338 [Stachybotrys elegans]|uniref:Uncharacterized protein n=1 Tax=Stachybotrys elegans TaxID=80388 RepID=A0A8K0SM86_9HYPO|nr:hypothetical protein B0I35DRAFT_244338 [Stachybotrys elegans]